MVRVRGHQCIQVKGNCLMARVRVKGVRVYGGFRVKGKCLWVRVRVKGIWGVKV